MANFPSSLDSISNPTPTTRTRDLIGGLTHSQLHGLLNDIIESLEAKVGVNSSAVTTSHDYKLSGVATGDKAVSKAGVETLTNKTFTSPVINTPTGDILTPSNTKTVTNKTLSTATALDANADPNITYYGIARQAFMNGNFDVWQWATTYGDMSHGNIRTADRWVSLCVVNNVAASGTGSVTQSQQLLTSGDIPGSYYYHRTNVTTAIAMSANANDYIGYSHSIEGGVRYLCGLNKTVTLSFWARSSVASKKIGIYLEQYYGGGGSPSATETIAGTTKTLTSTWTKYTYTFTTNTLVDKTFGTDNGSFLKVKFLWGYNTTEGTKVGDASLNSLAIGTYDIAQIQLCAGSVALPFQPKTYTEELRDCQRFAFILTNTTNGSFAGYIGAGAGTNNVNMAIQFPVPMRTVPGLTVTASEWQAYNSAEGAITSSSITLNSNGNNSGTPVTAVEISLQFAGTPITVHRPYFLLNNGASKKMIFTAEP